VSVGTSSQVRHGQSRLDASSRATRWNGVSGDLPGLEAAALALDHRRETFSRHRADHRASLNRSAVAISSVRLARFVLRKVAHGARVTRIAVFVVVLLSALACQSAPLGGPPLFQATNDPDLTFVPAGAPLPVLQSDLTSDPDDDDTQKPAISPAGGSYLRRSTNAIVLRAPSPPQGPRRIGIQVGHWQTDDVPPELHKLLGANGAVWGDVTEVDVNMDIGKRVAALLRKQGVVVDLLPTTVPAGYVADAFLALHSDSDGMGELNGFKLAHAKLRGPFEDRLVNDLHDAYEKGTGIAYDETRVGVDMRYYYAFNWGRFQHATSAHTPAAIIEMGYLSSDRDRGILTEDPDRVAAAIASGLMRFLSDTPRSQIFRDDIVAPLPPQVAAPTSAP
jgi:N-acetylmuramoyl-L-alanine amidase